MVGLNFELAAGVVRASVSTLVFDNTNHTRKVNIYSSQQKCR